MRDAVCSVHRPREAARVAYNRMSRWYDALARSERRFLDAGVRMLAAPEGARVLEIGCGTGYALTAIARAVGESGLVVGLDISDGMLAVAKGRLQRAGLQARALLVMGDAVALPCAAETFDAVFMGFTLELFADADIPAVLGECRRVLRSGGHLGVVALSREGAGRMVRLYEWAHNRWPVWVDCRPIYVRRALEDAGFVVIRAARERMWGLPVEIAAAARP
ncbi:MAG: methyltransferase domain-containing protein [Chloroflexi bacterium]|nr:methyltransferase domain-containing protein [Chloroflexota bacterium]